eukprot:658004-Pyramimonas_sp.AAC.1
MEEVRIPSPRGKGAESSRGLALALMTKAGCRDMHKSVDAAKESAGAIAAEGISGGALASSDDET